MSSCNNNYVTGGHIQPYMAFWLNLHIKRISLCFKHLAVAANDGVQNVIHLRFKGPERPPLRCARILPGKWESFGVMASWNSPHISMSVKEDEWQATRMLQCRFHSSTGISTFSTGAQPHVSSNCGYRNKDYRHTNSQGLEVHKHPPTHELT